MKISIKINAICGVLTCLFLLNVSAAKAASEAMPFWKRTNAEIVQAKFSPAEVELLAGPDLTHRLMTFKFQDLTGPVDYVPTNPVAVPFVKKDDEGYRILPKGLQKNARPFSDRDYRITLVPERLQNLTLLQTKMGHKGIVDARFAILLSVPQPVHLFLAIDERALETFEEFGIPAWLQEFAPTTEKVFTDDPIMHIPNKPAPSAQNPTSRKARTGRSSRESKNIQ